MRDVLLVVRKVAISLALLGVVAVTLPAASAQQNSAVRGGLVGVITDASGAAVPNAKITIVGPQQTVNITSNAQGRYSATGLIPGSYKVTVTVPGFSTYISKDNQVNADQSANLNVSLAVGNAEVTVEVDAGATTIDTDNTSINTTISDVFYESLPLPRNVSGAFYTAPGVVSGGGTGTANPSIGGSSGLENLYTADGVTITDQAYGGLGVYTPSHGSLGTGINLAFVKEVDIKTGAFEPKYGQGDGGIVSIVTKSGTNHYHGALDMYITPENGFANAKHLYQYNYVVTAPSSTLSNPAYELSGQFGGYVPSLRDKLFFFGAFDPTLTRFIVAPAPTSLLAGHAPFTESQTSANWAAKISYSPLSSTIIEASTYGDPSRQNSIPSTTAAANVASVSSSWGFGTRNSIVRVNALLAPWLTAFGAFSYNHASFAENPTLGNEAGYSDRRKTPYVQYGLGTYYTTRDNNWQLQGESQATAHFFGKHTLSVGYLFDHLDFENSTLRSGPGYNIPSTNAAGASLTSLYSTMPASSVGKFSNAQYRLQKANYGGCTYCALDAVGGNQVYFQVYRATYSSPTVSAIGRYKAAYGNEVYTPEKHVTINAGLRWEQQAYGGSLLTYYWRDNWSPRLGLTVDPMGDRKSKVFFSWSRYQAPLPLDAAVRQLGSELDDTNFYFAPQTSGGVAITDSTGAFVPDTSVALNGTPINVKDSTTGVISVGKLGGPSFASSTGEGILPGTKMEYTDEFILGVEHQVKPGMVASIRYTDRHFGRIVEDIGSQSPEGSVIVPNYAGGIANVNAKTDLFGNENEITYTPAQFAAANGGLGPGSVTAATYVAPVAGCTYANDIDTANGGYFTHYDGSNYNGACITNYTTADNLGADGKPDGFVDPRRHYQSLELELNRSLRNHWQAKINYRYAKLWGNYEGFFRNDNGQSDPGISSLFDFTAGALGLLGDQFKRGYLPNDRRHVANMLISYSVDKSTPFIGKVGNGLTVGTWVHASTGNPLSAFQSHPIYGNVGEVPIGGRGTKGTLPTAIQLDLHAEDAYRIADKYTIRAAFDGFNVTDSQPKTGQNQNLDVSPGSANADYGKPSAFQLPFSARFKLAFEF